MSVTRIFRYECDYCNTIGEIASYGFPNGFVYGYNKDTVVHICGNCKDKLILQGAKTSKKRNTKIDIPANLQNIKIRQEPLEPTIEKIEDILNSL